MFRFVSFRFVSFQSNLLFLENTEVFAIASRPVVKYGPADSRSPLWSAYLRDSDFRQATTLVVRGLDPPRPQIKDSFVLEYIHFQPFQHFQCRTESFFAMLKTVQ